MLLSPQALGEARAGLVAHVPRLRVFAFPTSTALSPTETPVLARGAKGFLILQALLSLLILVLLAARAVHML
jgi:hypothetical protein